MPPTDTMSPPNAVDQLDVVSAPGILDHLALNLCFLLGSILLLSPALGPVPSSNENLYLLDLARVWNPAVLSTDWTWAPPLYSHRFFSLAFGFLTLFFSLEVVGWIGRIISWLLILLGVFRLGRNLNVAPSMVSLAVFLWLLYQQSLVGGEFVLGTFEAKSVSYIFLFWGLAFLIEQRDFLGGLSLGMCFAFHAVIGMWALLGLGLAALCLRYSLGRLISMTAGVLLTAIPGLVVIWPTITGNWGLSQEQAKFLALFAAPFHLDPLSFPKRDVFLVFLLFVFNWVCFKSRGDEKSRLINWFLLFLGIFALLGAAARLAGYYRFLFYFPFRLFPLLVPLFFFMNLFSLVQQRAYARPENRRQLVLGMCALLALPSAVGQLIDQTKFHYGLWAGYGDWDDLQKSFIWVSNHTPREATIILPPWRKESYYLTQRATIAHWALPRFDRLQEWEERIKALVGNVFSDASADVSKKWDQYYHQLSETDLAKIQAHYGGDYLISRQRYSFPVAFDSGTYRVYALPGSKPKT